LNRPSHGNRLLDEETSYNKDFLAIEKEKMHTLNPEQRIAFDEILESVYGQSRIFFLDGPGGSGKTYLYNVLLGAVRHDGMVALAVASSGIASMLLSGGRTAHSRFKITLDANDCFCNIEKGTHLAHLLCSTKLIVWDEAPMAHKATIEAVDCALRDIRDNDSPFGGITVVFGGDFRQILPVIPKGNRAMTVQASLKRSYLWQLIKVLKLTSNMRVQGDEFQAYRDFIMRIGNGTQPQDEDGNVEFPQSTVVSSLDDLIESTYPDFKNAYKQTDYLSERSILTTRNDRVDDLNDKLLNLLDGPRMEYSSSDSLILSEKTNASLYPTEFLNSLDVNGCPPHKLFLKVGCPIILLRNLDANHGLCNGTRLIVQRLHSHVIEARIMTGVRKDEVVFIPRIDFIPETRLPFEFRRRQFPVRVCFAMTINKAQGQTIEHVGLYLPEPVFTHGQLYVGVSRNRNPEHFRICVDNPKKPNLTKNIVYLEILQ
jgi:ATP-dependent DNA helicase PIF1